MAHRVWRREHGGTADERHVFGKGVSRSESVPRQGNERNPSDRDAAELRGRKGRDGYRKEGAGGG